MKFKLPPGFLWVRDHVLQKLATPFSSHSNCILCVCESVFMAAGWLLPWHMTRNTYEESQTEPVSHAGKPILASAPCLLVIDPPNKSCGHIQVCSLSLCFPLSTYRLFMWRGSASDTQALFRPVLTKAWVQKGGWSWNPHVSLQRYTTIRSCSYKLNGGTGVSWQGSNKQGCNNYIVQKM